MRWLKVIALWLITAFFTPAIIKPLIDEITDPVTGIMVTAGDVPDYVIALTTSIPWLIYPIVFIIGIWYATRQEKPQYPRVIE